MRSCLLSFAALVACRGPSDPRLDVRVWSYDIAVEGEASELRVEGRVDRAQKLAIDRRVAPYVRELELQHGTRWVSAAAPSAISCTEACRFRYRLPLRDAATALDDPDIALARGSGVVAHVGLLLVRPDDADARGEVRLRVGPVAAGFATAIPATGDGEYRLRIEALDESVAVFGTFRQRPIRAAEGVLDVVTFEQELPVSVPVAQSWIEESARVLVADLGGLPERRILVAMLGARPADRTRGVTFGGGGATVVLRVGVEPGGDIANRWIALHELIHAAMPTLPNEQRWLSEGLASYLEPLMRARAKLIPREKVWRDLVRGLPQGLPGEGDRGLDRTPTWGRIYWGGSLFCLLADLRIRERSGRKHSLDDVLRATVRASAGVTQAWTVERFLRSGDAATGTSVLTELYAEMATQPGGVDLSALWKRLGVRVDGDEVRFDEAAPLATIRADLTERWP